MSAALQIAIAIGSVGTLLGLMALVRHLARARGWSAETQRKLVHIGTGLYALTLPWLFTDRWPVFLLLGATIVVMLILRLPGVAKGGLGEAVHGVERHSYGDLLLTLAVGTVFLLSDGQAILYVLPLSILALADAAAAMAGSTYGRRFFPVEDGLKSVEGTTVFFVTSFCLSMICLLVLSETPRVNVIYLSVIVAAFGALVEADSWRGFDNFFIPAGLTLFLQGHLDAPPMEIAGLMALFLAAIFAALWAAPKCGVSRHTARVYVIAGFLILSVVQPGFAVLPILIFVASAICTRRNPGAADHPELDIVAAVALVSFFWLALGRETDLYNIELYGLSALAMIVGLLTLALVPMGRLVALSGAVGVSAAGVALFHTLYAYDGVPNNIEASAPFIAAALGLAISTTLIWPGAFDRARALKMASLAMIAPLCAFALHWLERAAT